jgi:hypothetical protein
MAQATSEGRSATPAKLRSGAWGARVEGAVAKGDTLTITSRSGKSWRARVEKIVWTDGSASICATSSLDSGPPRSAGGATRRSGGRRPYYSSRPHQPRTAPPAGPQLARKQGADPFEVGELVGVILKSSEVAECEERQGITAVDLPGEPVTDGRRRVACVVLWAESMSADDVEDFDAWSSQHSAVVRLATADEAAPEVERRERVARRLVATTRLKDICKEVRERGEQDPEARYGVTPDGMVWDDRFRNSAGSTGDALGVIGDTVVYHVDHGYDMYMGVEWRLDDAGLAAEVRQLAAEAARP